MTVDLMNLPEEYDLLPRHLLLNLQHYVNRHQPVGDFLSAVLENDLQKAVAHADSDNQPILHLWARVVFNRIPGKCWGSRDAVLDWIKKGEQLEGVSSEG